MKLPPELLAAEPVCAIIHASPHEGTKGAMQMASHFAAQRKGVKIFNSYLHFEHAEAHAVDAGLSGFCRVFTQEPYNYYKVFFGKVDGYVEIECRKGLYNPTPYIDYIADICRGGGTSLVILDRNFPLVDEELKALRDALGISILSIQDKPIPTNSKP
jgi:hypothetical protein